MPPSVPAQGVPSDGTTAQFQLIRGEIRKKRSTKSNHEARHTASVKGQRNLRRKNLTAKSMQRITKVRRPVSSNSPRGATMSENKSVCGGTPEVESPQDKVSTGIQQLSTASDISGLTAFGGFGNMSPYGYYGGAPSMMPHSPYMGMNTMSLPHLFGLTQIVYNVQNMVFSISQAVFIVGANQQALQQAWESLNQMIEHAVTTFNEMRKLESVKSENETEEERQRRKKLSALRYAFVFGGGWLAYKLIRNLLFQKRRVRHHKRLQHAIPMMSQHEDHLGQPLYASSNRGTVSACDAGIKNYSFSPTLNHSSYSSGSSRTADGDYY